MWSRALLSPEGKRGRGGHDVQAGYLPQVQDDLSRDLIREGAPGFGGVRGNIEGHDDDIGQFGAQLRVRRAEGAPAEDRGEYQHADDQQWQAPRARGEWPTRSAAGCDTVSAWGDSADWARAGRGWDSLCRWVSSSDERSGASFPSITDPFRNHDHRRNELIPPATNRENRVLPLPVVPQDLARTLDVIAERRIRHFAPVPDFPEQLFPRQHPITMADQVNEQIEHLRLGGKRGVPAADPVPGCIDDEFGDPVFHSPTAAIVIE